MIGIPRRLALTALCLALPLVARAQATSPRDATISPATRDSVLDGVLARLDGAYVFPEKAAEMRRAIGERRSRGEYARITSALELATTLTRDLQAVSHDKHLRVRFADGPQATAPANGPPDRSAMEARARADNWGIGTPEILPGNIGYLEIRSFGFPPEVIEEAVAKAMSAVADADALIIDVRKNGGGSPFAVALVSSYLFGEEPVHLNSLYFRPADRTDHFHTRRTVSGRRFGPRKPVFVLTGNRTFSAAEEFTYNLQSLKRATIVGETTGGGAHPGGVERVAGGFSVFVPSGRAINPVTKTNWEGTGVRPDIAVPADSALAAALVAARAKKVM